LERKLLTVLRYLVLVGGLVIGLPLLILFALLPKTPISFVGTLYLVSYALIVVGMISAPWRVDLSFLTMLAGIVIGISTLTFRMVFPASGTQINLITLPGQAGPRLLNRIFDEQDVVLFGAQVAPYLGAISTSEKESLDSTFAQTFAEMRAQRTTPLSPFLTTYLNQQRPSAFDMVIAEPKTGTPPKNGIIFLHGFGGNFTVQCWLVARAGYHVDALTVCPSTRVNGDWWSLQGRSILQETLAYLQQRGVERIYLAGLSNGAIGASRLAAELKDSFAGLILISGADPAAQMADLPVLVLHGKHDERIPVSLMERYVSEAGSNATYHLFDGDHFLLLKQADQMQDVIAAWLTQQESDRQRK
jgi:pimeloyl-ACP methyl ester carboxylesterase